MQGHAGLAVDGQGIVEAVGDDQGELDAVVVDGFLDLAFIGQFDFLEAFFTRESLGQG
ncbi:hypothetical protein LP419_13195 [Massilia sp. H-1]|nr:hypothetical protein LP419_13195 [Massilia sp. H-1]